MWLLVGILFVVGCTRSTADFHVSIRPMRGHVPFQATVTATDIGDSYTFHLPNESITQDSPVLEVTVDSMYWTVVVETTCGGRVYNDDISAFGSNAPPRVDMIVINGIRDRWYLTPRERTLIEVDTSPGAEVVDVDVWGSGVAQHFSIFIAPYDGDYHAIYKNRYVENACIVYPLYCSIPPNQPGQTLPYAPTALETGYPYLIGQSTNAIGIPAASEELEIPAQSGRIQITVQDEIGQRTTRTFEIPIQACDFWNAPWPPPGYVPYPG